MKSNFPGYFNLSTPKIKRLWDDGIFVLDANILLGLYRYSDATRREFFKTLDAVKDRCWLPHQAVKEYFKSRLSVIGTQEDAYTEIIKSMGEMEQKFKNSNQHPFLSENILGRLCKDFETAKKELLKSKAFHTKRINDDDVLNGIEKIFNNRVGEPYSEEEIKKLIAEGEERYKKNTPPGFRDSKKEDVSDETRKYGDFILWKQVLLKAQESKQGIIFVCDDRKDDWWQQFRGKTLGARPELVKEFKQVTDTDFHMYTSDRFLEFAGEHFDRKVSPIAVSEMREMKRMDEEKRRQLMRARRMSSEVDEYEQHIEFKRNETLRELEQIEKERHYLYHQREQAAKGISMDDPAALNSSDFEAAQQISDRIRKLEHKEIMLHDQMMQHQKHRAMMNERNHRSQQDGI